MPLGITLSLRPLIRAVSALMVLFTTWGVVAGTSAVAGERRVALVIGNAQYEAVSRLPNPVRDAEAVAASLRESGFDDVILVENVTRERLVGALRRFSAAAARADWAVVYYAGHGIEMGGTNYLIPVDARLASDRDLQFEGVPMGQVMAAVEDARRFRLLILDACRDNPFSATMARTLGTSRSIGRGLARVEPIAGTLVAYAAKDGQVAEDGEGVHSPFVTALVRHMRTPGLEVARLFRRVTGDVLVATNRRQEPFTYGSLPDEDFYFRAPLPVPVEPAAAIEAPKAPPALVAAPPTVRTEPAPDIYPAPVPDRPKAVAMLPEPTVPAAPLVDAPKPVPVADPAVPPRPETPVARRRARARKPAAIVEPRVPAARIAPAPPVLRRKPRPEIEAAPVQKRKVVQQIERPNRTAAQVRPSTAGRCQTFNGERVCN